MKRTNEEFELTFNEDWYWHELEQLQELEAKVLDFIHKLPDEGKEEYKKHMGIITINNNKS